MRRVDELGLSEAPFAAEEVVLLPAVELDVRLVELVLLLVEDEFLPIDEGVKELELLASTMAAATVFPVPSAMTLDEVCQLHQF